MGLDQRKYNIIGIVKIFFESSLTLFMQDISIYCANILFIDFLYPMIIGLLEFHSMTLK